jgi:hypothetical protein
VKSIPNHQSSLDVKNIPDRKEQGHSENKLTTNVDAMKNVFV